MAVRLKFRAGSSLDSLVDITSLVNTGKGHDISSEDFEGEVIINIKGLTGHPESKYFDHPDREGMTWSIQVQGAYVNIAPD